MYSIPLEVHGHSTHAIIDTASEVTIISDELFNQFDVKPPIIKQVTFQTAGKDLKMNGFLVGPVNIELGKSLLKEWIYVAPIKDEMLLGVNFLKTNGVILDLLNDTLRVGEQELPLNFGTISGPPKVAKVMLMQRQKISPNTVVHVPCLMDEYLSDYVVEPSWNLPVVLWGSFHPGEELPKVCLINTTDKPVTLKKGKVLTIAVEGSASTSPLSELSLEEEAKGEENLEDLKTPEHLQELYERTDGRLRGIQKPLAKRALIKYQDVFAKTDFDLGNFTAIKHEIHTGDSQPSKQRMRRTPMCFAQEEEAHLKKMLEAGVIQPSVSEWASPPVLVRKRDGGVRWCVDYRALNSHTTKDVYPLPLIEECLDTLSGHTWFSKLDANSAYWQVHIKPEHQRKTAFTTKYGLFEFNRMPFGLCNAPATFSRVMNLVLRGLTWDIVLAFLDDILVLGTSFENHLDNLTTVFERLRQFQLKLKPANASYFSQKSYSWDVSSETVKSNWTGIR